MDTPSHLPRRVAALATNAHTRPDGAPLDLTCYVVRYPSHGAPHGSGRWSVPMASSLRTPVGPFGPPTLAPPKTVALRALRTDMLIELTPRLLASAFAALQVPNACRGCASPGDDDTVGVFVSTRPLGGFSRAQYAQLRAALPPGACETDAFAHVPVRALLAATAAGEAGGSGPGGDPAAAVCTVRDIDGADLPLRRAFVSILCAPSVRALLQAQVAAYDAAHGRRGPGGLRAGAPPAAPSAESQAMHLVAEVPPLPGSGRPPFRLWVGDLLAANSREMLRAAGVTHVVCCCSADFPGQPDAWTPFAGEGVQYSVIHSDDRLPGGQDPSGQWPAAMALLREAAAWPLAGGGAARWCALLRGPQPLRHHRRGVHGAARAGGGVRRRAGADPRPAPAGAADAALRRVRARLCGAGGRAAAVRPAAGGGGAGRARARGGGGGGAGCAVRLPAGRRLLRGGGARGRRQQRGGARLSGLGA